MERLTVLYDAECGFCVKCRWWLVNQPKFVEMEFLPAGGPEARGRYPELFTAGKAEELVVVTGEGGVYRGASAWVMCLWALEEYREWSERLSTPLLMPLARGAFGLISASRKSLSKWFGLAPEEEVVQELERASPPRCEG